MPVKLFDKIGTLDKRTPENRLNPADAVTATYFDPFRSEPGTIMPCYGFKDGSPTGRPDNWETDGYPRRVVGAFVMAGTQFVITAQRVTTDPNFGHGLIYYVDPDGAMQTVTPYFPYLPRILPSRILVDPNVYTMGKPEEPDYREFYNTYIWGYDDELELRKPWRLMLCKKYENGLGDPDNYQFIFKITKAAMYDLALPSLYTLEVAYAGPSEPTGPAIGHYRYFVILEDVCGNWIYLYDSEHFNRRFESTSGAGVKVKMTIENAADWGFTKMYVYRDDITSSDPDNDEYINPSFAQARLVGITDFSYDIAELVDRYANQSDLTDLTSVGRQELRAWCENANKAYDSIGYHNNALWISRDNEVFFSQYDLSAPYGTRPLNFPSVNRWRFEDVGKIIDILSVNHKLYVIGTEGISALSGTYIDNFYEEKISNIGVSDCKPQYGEWIKTGVVVGDEIYFVDKDGRVCSLYRNEIRIFPQILVQKVGSVTDFGPTFGDVEVIQQIDACHYRGGYMVANGDTIWLFDPKSGQWMEWSEDVRRFFVNFDPFYEDKTIDDTAATDYSYLELIDDDGNWRVYATDGTYQSSVWRSPKVIFDEDQKFELMVLHWEYNSNLPYGEVDADPVARSAETPAGTIDFYLDDSTSSIRTDTLNFLFSSNGDYRCPVVVNCRGRKFAFQITMTAGRYWKLTGFELKHSPRGRKSYG